MTAGAGAAAASWAGGVDLAGSTAWQATSAMANTNRMDVRRMAISPRVGLRADDKQECAYRR
jgi:hypothetical protein